MADWLQILQDNFPDIKTGKFFSDFTTLQIGGPITAFLETKTKDELVKASGYAKENSIPYLVIGGGSNLLVSDEGFDSLVIKVQFSGIEKKGEDLIVQAGTKLQDLIDFTVENSLGGIHRMTGIPGTVGGAIYGKIAAYGDDISDFLKEVHCFDGQNIVTISKEECQFGYRDSIFKINKFPILEVVFTNLPFKDSQQMNEENEQILDRRTKLYPPDSKCPGSLFKNTRIQDTQKDPMEILSQKMNPDIFARVENNVKLYGKIPTGALLEDLSAKGDKLGQVQISPTHGNTFINLGGGTAKDFYNLAKKYYLKVKEKFGIELTPEVQFINLPPFDQ